MKNNRRIAIAHPQPYAPEQFLSRGVYLAAQSFGFRCVRCLRVYRVVTEDDDAQLGDHFWECPFGCPEQGGLDPDDVMLKMKLALYRRRHQGLAVDGDGEDEDGGSRQQLSYSFAADDDAANDDLEGHDDEYGEG